MLTAQKLVALETNLLFVYVLDAVLTQDECVFAFAVDAHEGLTFVVENNFAFFARPHIERAFIERLDLAAVVLDIHIQ